jgi:hypothetical protein
MKNYRIREFCNEFNVEVEEDGRFVACGQYGTYAWFSSFGANGNPPMPPFKTLEEAEEKVRQFIKGPIIHNIDIPCEITELSEYEKNGVIFNLIKDKGKLIERIDKYNKLPWYRRIFIFCL